MNLYELLQCSVSHNFKFQDTYCATSNPPRPPSSTQDIRERTRNHARRKSSIGKKETRHARDGLLVLRSSLRVRVLDTH